MRPAWAGVANSGSEAHVTHVSDPELVRRTLQGDTTAFGTLVERYKQAVYGVCVSLLGDFALAQDLAQEAFLKAFQHVHRLAMPERFGNWLCIIARNECLLYLRQVHATEASGHAFYDQACSGQAHLVPVEQQQELRHQQDYHERLGAAALQALQTLSEKNRQVITLYYLSGYSLKELGALLGISPTTAKMRLHRARQHLRKEAITMVENALTQQQLGPDFITRMRVADMTILFTDMVGTTRLLGQLPPEEALDLLYTYMNTIAQILVDHGATLHIVAGDAIIAFWGAPAPTPDHAVQGCLAALAIQTGIAELRTRQQHEGKPALHVKCGLQSGRLFVSALGSRGPQAYTLMGQASHIASRLESMNTRLGTSILIGDATYQQAQEAIEARAVGQFKLSPYPDPIMAYEVLARKGDLEPRKAQASARYLEGFAHYQARRWEQALAAFRDALQLDPSDGPSRYYQERCETLLAAPPEMMNL
jgi:RNA polymerase sigma factor (sigma-70 family)